MGYGLRLDQYAPGLGGHHDQEEWTDQELLALLEGVELHKEDWTKVGRAGALVRVERVWREADTNVASLLCGCVCACVLWGSGKMAYRAPSASR